MPPLPFSPHPIIAFPSTLTVEFPDIDIFDTETASVGLELGEYGLGVIVPVDVDVVESGGRGSADRRGDLDVLGALSNNSKGAGAPPGEDSLDFEAEELVEVEGEAHAIWPFPLIESVDGVGEAAREHVE